MLRQLSLITLTAALVLPMACTREDSTSPRGGNVEDGDLENENVPASLEESVAERDALLKKSEDTLNDIRILKKERDEKAAMLEAEEEGFGLAPTDIDAMIADLDKKIVDLTADLDKSLTDLTTLATDIEKKFGIGGGTPPSTSSSADAKAATSFVDDLMKKVTDMQTEMEKMLKGLGFDPSTIGFDPTKGLDPGKLPTDPSKLPTDPSKLPTDPSKLPTDPSKLPTDPSKLPTDPSKLPKF
jgi:hypothetical protein